MSSNLKVNSLVPATGTEIGIGTTGGSIDFRCPATFGGNVTIGGTLTYDEVINIDSIGVITARSNIDCNGSLDVDGHTNLDNVSITGVTTLSHTGTNQLIIKDSDTTGDDSRMRISFRDAGNTEKFFVGNNTTNGWLYLGSPSGQNNNIAFRVNGNDKFQVNGSGAYVNGALTVAGNADISDSIIHTGDTNTKIRFPAADTVTVETAGSERLRIDSSGRLLLNTTTTYVSNQMMIVKGASPSAGGNRPYDGQLAIEGSETTGAINTGGVLAFIGHSGTGSRGFGSIRCLKEDGTSGNYGSYMSFETRTNGSAPAEKLRIDSNGKVLIGGTLGLGGATSNPSGLLHAQTSSGEAEVKILGATNGVIQLSGYAGNSTINFGDSSSDTPGRLQYNHGNDSFHIRTGSNNRLHIMGNGDYGFNDSSPTAHASGNNTVLSIKGKGSSYSGKIDFKDSSGNIDSYINSDNSILEFYADPNSQNGNTLMRFFVHGGERVRIDSSGRVGVNQSSFATSDTMFSVSETSGHCEIGIISKNDSGVVINMGDTDSYNQGRIKYDNSDNSLTFRTSATDRFRIKSDGSLRTYTDADGVSCFSNNAHGNIDFNHRGSRVLHSNGTGWGSPDGQDPILVLAVENRAGNSDIGNAYGLCLHSESQDNNDYGPMIGWSNRSNSGSYNTTYAAVVGKKTGQAADSNWSAGELQFYTMPTGGYIDNTPNMSIDSSGRVLTPRQISFYATANSGGTVSMTSTHTLTNWRLSTSGKTYSIGGHFNTSNGRFTAPIAGKYLFTASILLAGYDQANSIHMIWRKNGTNYQYWYNTRTSDIDRSGYGGYLAQGSTTTFSLSANDYIDIACDFGGSLSLWCGDQNWGHFSGHLLG